MRTYLVNPTRRRNSSHAGGGMVVAKNATLAPNPRRRRGGNPAPVLIMNPRRRKRAHNPLVLPNRRRRRKRNPSFSLMSAATTVGIGFLGGGASFVLNKYLISKVGVNAQGFDNSEASIWLRIAARAVGGALGAFIFPGQFGSAFVGAMAYPAFNDLDGWWAARQVAAAGGATATSADLSDVEADLADVLDGLS